MKGKESNLKKKKKKKIKGEGDNKLKNVKN